MDRTEFADSTAIAEIRYLPDDLALEVTFTSGAVYLYAGVPVDVAEGFSAAASPGTFFQEEIRNLYSYRRLR